MGCNCFFREIANDMSRWVMYEILNVINIAEYNVYTFPLVKMMITWKPNHNVEM